MLFKAIYLGSREIGPFDSHELFAKILSWQRSNNDDLVARSGFEPLISALRGLHPRPLDERAGGITILRVMTRANDPAR